MKIAGDLANNKTELDDFLSDPEHTFPRSTKLAAGKEMTIVGMHSKWQINSRIMLEQSLLLGSRNTLYSSRFNISFSFSSCIPSKHYFQFLGMHYNSKGSFFSSQG